MLEKEIDLLLECKANAIFKSNIEKCSIYLTKMYNKAKNKLIHQDNFRRALYYLSVISENKLYINNIYLLNNLKFKNAENDSIIMDEIEINIFSNNSFEKIEKVKTRK